MKKLITLALVLTLLFSLSACGSGNDNNDSATSSGIAVDLDEDTFYFDRETIEMFGGPDEFMNWLIYDLGLDADDVYTSRYGEYYNSPVEKVNEEREWLDGYRTVEGVKL